MRELGYWKKQLAGIPEQLELPTDRPRPAVRTFEAEACQQVVSAAQVAGLKRLSEEHQATLYMTLLAAFGVLLSRYSGQDDIVVGSPIANRQEVQLEEMIGFFVNTLVMRMRVKGEMSFGELMGEVRKTALEAYQHQEIPFERLVEELSPERSLNRAPVCQVVFALQNAPQISQRMKGLEVEPVRGGGLRVRFDLEVHAREQGGEIRLVWLYNRDLFDRWRIEQMAGQYVRILEAVTAEAGQQIREIDLLGAEERRRILEGWNDTERAVPQATLPELFEQQVERTPDAVAVVFEDQQLSYRELNDRANRLAHCLRTRGVESEVMVGIYLRRKINMVIGVIATLKAGGAYLPVDAGLPQERFALMLEDAKCNTILTETEFLDSLSNNCGGVIVLDAEEGSLANYPANNLVPIADTMREMAAYVIYTSGSTGHPKGVLVGHKQIVNYVEGVSDRVEFSSSAPFALMQPLAFDFSMTVLFTSICKGLCLHIIPEEGSNDPIALGAYFEREGIEYLKITPSHLAALQINSPGWERIVSDGRRLLLGGEASRWDWVDKLHQIAPECLICQPLWSGRRQQWEC